MEIVKDFELDENVSIGKLFEQMKASGGFTAKNFSLAVDVLERMLKEKNCLKVLSFPACIVATGTRGVLKDMIKKKWFDVVVTTCGTLDHDIARSYKNYYHGSFWMDDKELHRKGINRLGNVLVPNESYGIIIEDKMQEWLKDMCKEGKKEFSTYELCWEIGKRIDNKNSILHWCWKNGIHMIVPGITDGAVGFQLWQFSQNHDIKIDVLKDEKLMSDFMWKSKKTGAFIIGGGISKHHVIWWAQFAKGLDYAVYVTTAQEYDGSLSGARPREAISWGKIKEEARNVIVDGDATVYLPLIFAAVNEKLKNSTC